MTNGFILTLWARARSFVPAQKSAIQGHEIGSRFEEVPEGV